MKNKLCPFQGIAESCSSFLQKPFAEFSQSIDWSVESAWLSEIFLERHLLGEGLSEKIQLIRQFICKIGSLKKEQHNTWEVLFFRVTLTVGVCFFFRIWVLGWADGLFPSGLGLKADILATAIMVVSFGLGSFLNLWGSSDEWQQWVRLNLSLEPRRSDILFSQLSQLWEQELVAGTSLRKEKIHVLTRWADFELEKAAKKLRRFDGFLPLIEVGVEGSIAILLLLETVVSLLP